MACNDETPALPDDDDKAIEFVVQHLKSEGIFDSMRKECLDDMDQKAAFMTQTHKIEEFVKRYCDKTEWNSSLNKNQHRERLRRTLNESEMMRYGVERLVDDAVTAKERSFHSPIEQAVRQLLGMDIVKQEDTGDTNHNSETAVVDMDIEDQDEDMDRGEQDMELSDGEEMTGTAAPAIENRIHAFVRSMREVNSSPPVVKVEDAVVMPAVSSIPMPSEPPPAYPPSPQSSPSELEAPMYSPIRPDDGIHPDSSDHKPQPGTSTGSTIPTLVVVKQEPLDAVSIPVSIPTPLLPQPLPQPPKLTTMKQEPMDQPVVSKSAVKKSPKAESPAPDTGIKDSKRRPSQPQPAPQLTRSKSASKEKMERMRNKEAIVKQESVASSLPPETDQLSDVSSVHTSDLSDYDDQISLSSGDEESEKKKMSIEEVRRLADEVTKNSGNKKQVKQKKSATPKSRRERKANPKYTSDEYSSLFGRKSGLEEDIESDEDFDQDAGKSEDASVSPPDDSSSFIDIHPKSSKKSVDQDVGEATGSPTAVTKPVKKKVSRQQSERYDASDLYKPRPMIGSSRRNRSQAGNSDTT